MKNYELTTDFAVRYLGEEVEGLVACVDAAITSGQSIYEVKYRLFDNITLDEETIRRAGWRGLDTVNNKQYMDYGISGVEEVPSDILVRVFQLSSLERDLLLLAVASIFHQNLESKIRILDPECPPMSISWKVIQKLFASSLYDSLGLRRFLAEDGKLILNSLLVYRITYDHRMPPIYFGVHKRIIQFLIGEGTPSKDLTIFLQENPRNVRLTALHIESSIIKKLVTVSENLIANVNKNVPLIIMFSGKEGVGKRSAAGAVFLENGRRLLELDLRRFLYDRTLNHESFAKELLLECRLLDCGLSIQNGDLLTEMNSEQEALLHSLFDILPEIPGGVVLYSEKRIRLPVNVIERFNLNVYDLEFPSPGPEFRTELWNTYLNGHTRLKEPLNAEILGGRYVFTGSQIRRVVRNAQNRSLFQDENRDDNSNLLESCRSESRHNLSRLARRIDRRFSWDDLILSPDHIRRLKELTLHLKHRERVYGPWGFESHGTAGRGLHVLFSGQSGTGKTMAAGIIAGDTGLELYRIDLATVVSKYIGETEKNLSRIFDEARDSNAILFFDEADALFGKRSDVKDARDRYANVEVAHLLQKLEEYDGMTILATNLSGNIDEAFRRRLHFIIEFPTPDRPTAKRLWMSAFPQNAPTGDDIDYEFLSNEIQFSGGNIKSVALNSAFFAAEDDSSITMKHVMRAVRREYQKLGRPFSRGDMKEYYDLVMGENDSWR